MNNDEQAQDVGTTALTAATIGTGALASAPPATAMPLSDCRYYLDRYRSYLDEAGRAVAAGNWGSARYFFENAHYYGNLVSISC